MSDPQSEVADDATPTTESPAVVAWPPAGTVNAPVAVEEVDIAAATYEEPEKSAAPEPEAPGRLASIVSEETINDTTENKVNIALFHIERLQQLVPDITGWSEEQALAVNTAIAALETSLKDREEQSDTYHGLRETVKSARRHNRDIDVMVALTDRAAEIDDLLIAHDGYSRAVREALFTLKPASVKYVAAVTKPARRTPARKRTTRTTTTPAPAGE